MDLNGTGSVLRCKKVIIYWGGTEGEADTNVHDADKKSLYGLVKLEKELIYQAPFLSRWKV
jgi:hypothetical protein